MNIRKVLRRTHRELTASPVVPAVIVFLTITALVVASWQTAQQDIVNTERSLIEERATLSEANIVQQIYSYENALLSSKGLFLSSDDVDRGEWRYFIDSLNIQERRRGMLGIGFSELIKPNELANYERRVRSEGYENFEVWPKESPRDIYSSITFIEPYNDINRPALGYDMYAESIRREAMDRSIDSGGPEMTSRVLLVQGAGNRIAGLNLYLALYKKGAPIDTVEQRRAAVTGFIYAPFISEDLFGSVFSEHEADYSVRVYDGTEPNPDHILYDQHKGDDDFRWVKTDVLDIAGVDWTFEFGVKDSLIPPSIRQRPRNVAFGGLILAAVAGMVVYMLLQRRMKSLADKEEHRVQKAKDSMLSLASHQLRTPATGVKQYVGMVLEGFTGDLNPEQQSMLKSAYDSNERQLRIINEFLYLAKTEADRIILTPQRFDLVQLVSEVVETMQGDIKAANHKLKFKPKNKKIYVAADMHSMRMIVENLISNAVKYTPSGGKIDLDVKKSKDEVIFSVKDNGVGIAEKDFPLLFKQFSRIPNELTRHISGSGIGLYLATQLAERNRGYITLESEPDVGSEFILHLTTKTVKIFTDNPKSKV